MSEIWDKPITDTTDWGGDSSTGGLPVSGRQVQAWLKSRIAKILTEAQITKIIEDWVQENGFADDEGFVTLSSDQEINGLKNFLQGLMVNGGLVKYDPELKVWQLTGNLLVSGGISMYSNLEGFKPSTIMDGILTDEVTITVKDGRLTVLAAESGLNYDELDAYLKKYEYTTISEVDARISELVNGAPQAYDTLKEIADVLEGNVNSIGDILAILAEKANTTYVDEAIADTKTWVEEQQYINEIDPSYIEAALGYQPYDGDTNSKEFTTKTYVKDNFVSRTLANEIEAIHNFLNGFTIAGIPFRKMANGSLFIDANVVFSGGATMYGTDTTPAPSIFDGLPIDGRTIKRDGNGALYVDETALSVSGGGGGVADSVAWANVTGKPKWLQDAGNAKPTYNYSEIQGTPDLSAYFPTSNFTKANIKTTLGISDWALASAKPTYTASEVGALGINDTAVNASKLDGVEISNMFKYYGQNTDLNIFEVGNKQTTTHYINSTDTAITNAPTYYGTAVNFGARVGNFQLFASNTHKLYFRQRWTSNWGDWKSIAFTSDIPSLAGYATESWVNTALAGYLPLSGGMIYGNGADLLGINRIDGNPAIAFYYNNTTMGRLGFDTSGDAVAQVGGEYKKILHAGNYSTLLAGGTINGSITAPSFIGNLTGNTANIGTLQIITNEINGANGTGDAHINYASTGKVTIANGGGNVAIGGATASAKLHVYGNLLTEGGITMYSQRSLKNILSYDGLSLEQLSVIKPIKFTWKDGRDNRYHVGGVADDVATVVPEVVYSANDFFTMDYGNAGFYVAASLIKPVINHEQRIKILEQENKALRDEINQLKQAS